MTLKSVDDPKHWRDRAEEIRNIADGMHDQRCITTMLGIAEDYERLATQTEERLARALYSQRVRR